MPHPADGQEQDVAKRRGIYFLPNVLTTAALFFGFHAMVLAIEGRFTFAAVCIFIAALSDGLDGRIARMTGTQSDFGQQYDSLSDLVCFGVAPALLVYQWCLSGMGTLGWLSCFLYATTTTLRLARFNVQHVSIDKPFFQGLPSPAAAGLLAGLVLVGERYDWSGKVLTLLCTLFLTLGAAGLMVSMIRYHSGKQYDFRHRMPFPKVILVVMVLALIAINPPLLLFFLALLYALSGPVLTLLQMQRHRLQRSREDKEPPPKQHPEQ